MSDATVHRLLEAEIGLDLESVGAASVRAAVSSRMVARKLRDPEDYSKLLAERDELAALIDEVVIPETWFFRDRAPFEMLARIAERAARGGRPSASLRVLSAPCSSGEEPYSIAMTLLDAGLPAARFRIDGLDVSAPLLARARAGTYPAFSFRGGDFGFRERHFTRLTGEEERWQISQEVRQSVTFVRDNLLAPVSLGSEGPYDLIFCRNLLIYLTPAARQRLLDTLVSVLDPGGRIVAGHAEALDAMDATFVATEERGAFAYALRGRTRGGAQVADAPSPPAPVEPKRSSAPSSLPAPPAPISDAPVSSGARAKQGAPRPAASPALPPRQAKPLGRAAELADRGELEAAAALCEERLREVGDEAAAHQLLGVIRQAQGDEATAERCFSRALYCDPDRASAMLHLALLLERRGERAGAATLRRRAQRVTQTAGRAE